MAKKLDQKMLTGFVRETRLYLPEIWQGLEQFHQDATQREGLEEGLGYAHTIKGASIMVGFPVLSHLAAYMEETLQEVVGGRRSLDAPCLGWFQHVLEQLEQYLEALLAGDAQQPTLVTTIVHDFRRFKGLPEADDAAAVTEALSEHVTLTPARPVVPVDQTAPGPQEAVAVETDSDEIAPTEEEDEDFAVELLSATVEEDAAALEAQEQTNRLAAAAAAQQAAAPEAEPVDAMSTALPAAGNLEALISSIDHDVHRIYSREAKSAVPLGPVAPQAERYVLFTLAGSRYAVPVPHVLEIGRIPHITPVPHVPAWVRGVINMRGEILSVIDFRTLLGLEEAHHSEQSRMLVVKTTGDEITTSLIVDQVTGIVPLTEAPMDLPATSSSHKAAAYLRGAYEHNEQVCAVFDLERLLLSPEVRQFE